MDGCCASPMPARTAIPYTPIGRTLIADGALKRAEVSMQSIRAWLTAHPVEGRRVMETDASFIFFKQEEVGDRALGPAGSEGVALTPRASIAVDPTIHAFGTPMFIAGRRTPAARSADRRAPTSFSVSDRRPRTPPAG